MKKIQKVPWSLIEMIYFSPLVSFQNVHILRKKKNQHHLSLIHVDTRQFFSLGIITSYVEKMKKLLQFGLSITICVVYSHLHIRIIDWPLQPNILIRRLWI